MFKTINGWTKARMIQEIQTKMLDHKSTNGFVCVYRAPDGNRCAMGVFIPDDLYDSKMECKNAHALTQRSSHYEIFKPLLAVLPLGFEGMTDLQAVHDNDYIQDTEDPRPRLIKWIEENVEDAA